MLKPVADVFDKITELVSPRHWTQRQPAVEIVEDAFDAGLSTTKLEPDKVLRGMNVIVSKIIPNATVQDVYQLLVLDDEKIASSAGPSAGRDKQSFYRSWLEATDRENVEISPWSVASKGEPFIEDWSKEAFERTIPFPLLG